MKHRSPLASVIVAVILGCALAGQCSPASQPAEGPTTAPAAEGEAGKILLALEKAGREYETIKADLKYQVVNPMLGDKETRSGWVAYRKAADEKPGGLRIHFATLSLDDGPTFEEKIDYAFDGRHLSIARHKLKQINRYRVARDQRQEAMTLGKGPLPLPFGQKAEEILKRFNVSARPARDDEPKDCDYLRLVPKEGDVEEISAVRIEMWVDRATHLPVKIVSLGRDRNTTTVSLENVRTNLKLEDSVFALPRPLGWRETIENLSPETKLTP